ncbi:MAG: amidohydrolase family protein, partial [Planctomycetes bacterium]|nr:amidohydrolase family protein [Planctomycetota bacterium]
MNDDLIDVNVYLGRWPFRRLPHDEPASLTAKLRQKHVKQAWCGSFEGLFHKDITAVNARLADNCRRHGEGFLIPFGSINPKLPDWQGDLQRCIDENRMPGVRLHPSYHGYTLDDPEFVELLKSCAEHRLLVQIVVRMEDERTQHPLARVPTVDTSPLQDATADLPSLQVMLLNSQRDLRADVIDQLAAT